MEVKKIDTRFFRAQYNCYSVWVRLFGYGIAWKNTDVFPLLFSQRSGRTKGFFWGGGIFIF